MKRGFTLFLLFVFLLTNLSLAAADFRDLNWGANPSEVKKSEDGKLIADASFALIFETTLSGFKAKRAYYFDEERLVTVLYSIEEPINSQTYTNYNNLRESLFKKYGKPYFIFFENGDSSSEASRKVVFDNGEISEFVSWKTERTEITYSAENHDDLMIINIIYAELGNSN